MKSNISFGDFTKLEMRLAKILKAEEVKDSRKLIKLKVDVGEGKTRTIFTGVRSYGYTASDFEEKQFLFVTNLEPKKMMGEESQGMILAVDGKDGKHLFIETGKLPVGRKVR